MDNYFDPAKQNFTYICLMLKHLKDELHNVISGKSPVRFGTTIQAITGYLKDCTQTGRNTSEKEQVKKQEKEKLENYISENNLWR